MRNALVLIVSLALVIAVGIGTTIAWLTDKTETVANAFTVGNIEIALDEAKVDENGKIVRDTNGEIVRTILGNSYKIIPGFTYPKDPIVTVKANNEACYLFVKFEQGEAPKYFKYDSNLKKENGWKQVADLPATVWYREVTASDKDQSWKLLVGDTITVKDTVTEELMEAASAEKLVYTAYAIQLYKSNTDKFTPAEAWEEVSKTTK